MISPPTWGWPDSHADQIDRQLDFPTHVGMARQRPQTLT